MFQALQNPDTTRTMACKPHIISNLQRRIGYISRCSSKEWAVIERAICAQSLKNVIVSVLIVHD
jgi:hypothetical protein